MQKANMHFNKQLYLEQIKCNLYLEKVVGKIIAKVCSRRCFMAMHAATDDFHWLNRRDDCSLVCVRTNFLQLNNFLDNFTRIHSYILIWYIVKDKSSFKAVVLKLKWWSLEKFSKNHGTINYVQFLYCKIGVSLPCVWMFMPCS